MAIVSLLLQHSHSVLSDSFPHLNSSNNSLSIGPLDLRESFEHFSVLDVDSVVHYKTSQK